MKILEIIKKLELEIIAGYENDDIEVEGAYIGDLLSLVMAKGEARNVWITIQTHLNILAVANLVDMGAIIIAENMEIDEDTIDKANELKLPLLKSHKSAYKLASELSKLGI